MAKRKTLLDRFFSLFEKVEFIRALFDWGGLAKPVISFLVTLVGVISGILQGVPFIVLIAGTVLIFAGSMLALNELDNWIDRNSLNYKLIFARALVRCIASQSQYASTKLVSYQPAAIFKNTGKKDLWYRVESFHAVVQAKSVANPQFDSRGGMIAADHEREYRYAVIPSVDCSVLPIEGVMEYTIRFGPSRKRLKFVLKERWRFEVSRADPNDNGPPTHVKVSQIELDDDDDE